MGSIYRQRWKTKDGTVQESPIWWIKYYRDGKPMRESSESDKISIARDLLKDREGDIVKGVAVSPKVNRVRFSELAADMVNDYKVNKKRSLDVLEMRLLNHVLPFFGARRTSAITTAEVNRFILLRQEAGATNGEINRELTHVKRAFSPGIQSAKILTKPYIPMLLENNVRLGSLTPRSSQRSCEPCRNTCDPLLSLRTSPAGAFQVKCSGFSGRRLTFWLARFD